MSGFSECGMLLLLLQLIFYWKSVGADKPYFDPTDFFYADCVDLNAPYFYFGQRNTTASKQTCQRWSTVMDYHNQLFDGYNQFFFPDEYEDHNHCRQIYLDDYERDPLLNHASAHHYVQIDGWQHGPWCYVEVSDKVDLWKGRFQSKYRPSPCFSACEQKN